MSWRNNVTFDQSIFSLIIFSAVLRDFFRKMLHSRWEKKLQVQRTNSQDRPFVNWRKHFWAVKRSSLVKANRFHTYFFKSRPLWGVVGSIASEYSKIFYIGHHLTLFHSFSCLSKHLSEEYWSSVRWYLNSWSLDNGSPPSTTKPRLLSTDVF